MVKKVLRRVMGTPKFYVLEEWFPENMLELYPLNEGYKINGEWYIVTYLNVEEVGAVE